MAEQFTLTADHIRLLRRMYVGWCSDEYGAPEIDPKRPYGNSQVELDICEILEWPYEGDEEPGTYLNYSDEQCERAANLHLETRVALQLVLTFGSFEPATFGRENAWSPWLRCQEGAVTP